MAISVGVVVANLYYVQPILPDIAREFGLSEAQAGLLPMLGMAGVGIGQVLFVPLGDIRERRKLMLSLILACAFLLAMNAIAMNGTWMMIATFLLGMSTASNHITIPFAAHLASPGQRGRVVGTVISGLLIGILASRAWSGWIGEEFGWRAVFWIGTVIMLSLAVLLLRFLPRSEPTMKMTYPQLLASAVPLWRNLPVLRESVLVNAVMFGVFNGFWTAMVFFVEGPPYFYTSKGAGMFSLIGAAGAMCAPIAGRLADKRGGRESVLVAILTTIAAFLVMGLFGTNLGGFIVGIILLDLATQFGHVTNLTRIYAPAPEARSRLNMIYMTFSFSGGAIGSVTCVYVWTIWGWWGVCGFSLAALISMLLAWWWLSSRHRAADAAAA